MRKPFVCIRRTNGSFLALGPREGPYTAWVEHVANALKFKTEDEALEWCEINKVRGGDISYWR